MITEQTHLLLPPDLNPIKTLDDYRRTGGLKGLERARSLSSRDVIQEVKNSGLRGRGGAGFPAGVKWDSVANDECETTYVVCNSAEGEPGTYKDRYLLRKNPYLMLEGVLIASYAVGAKGAFVGIKRKFTAEVERIRIAIKELEQAGIMKKGFIKVVLGPDEYLFGEEKALLEVIDGRGAMPRILPPYMQGVGYTPIEHNPTVVNNVETMSNLPNILSRGADWFRTIGTADSPGTMIFTLSGDIKNPGMYEIPMGTTLKELLYDIGGGPVGEFPIKAVFSGVANPVILPNMFDTPLDFGSMRKVGSGLGSGGLVVYDESACMVKVALMFSKFLALSSCGQCIPCNRGCGIITDFLQMFEKGQGRSSLIRSILHECGRVTNQTRCYLPVQESRLVTSLIEKFRSEFDAHIKKKKCDHSRTLILPKIENFDEESRYFIYQGDKQAFQTL